MAIYRRKHSRFWWINIPRGKGVPRLQVSSGTEDEAEARIIERTLKTAMRKESTTDRLQRLIDALMGEDPESTTDLMPLTDIWEVYAASPAVSVSSRTMKIRHGHLNRLIVWLEGKYPTVTDIEAVTTRMAFEYADHLAEITATGKTYNEHRATLSHIWKSVAKRAGIEHNVWSDIPRASKADSQSGRAFSANEVESILRAAYEVDGGWWYAPSMMSLYTGLRLSSLKSLKWSEVDGDWLIHTPPKTQKHRISVRIPLHRCVTDALSEFSPSKTGKLFPWLTTRKNTAATFSDVLVAAGVDTTGHVTFHCWRHTFRTRLAQARVSEDAAKRLGGWTTDINLIYNHDETQLRDAIDSLDPV